MDINIDALYNILKQNQGDVNDALGYKKKIIVVTSDPLALVAEKTNVRKRKEKVVVSPNSKGSGTDDFSELKKITALLAKAFNRRKFYSKPTNNNLRISSTSQSANKKQKFVKSDDKKIEKKADEKKRDMSKFKCYNCKKERHFAKDCKKAKVKDYNYNKTKMLLAKKDSDEQVLLAEDQAWMESSSDSDQEINANMVFIAQIKKVLSESDESSSSAKETIAEMSRDVLTVGSTMRIPLLYRGEYSQWVERFMNYLEEQTNGEAMINSIKNGDQPLPHVTQVSIVGTSSTEQPPLKDKSMWSDQEKRIQKIDRLARSLLIQGLLNDIYSLIDSNKTAKDLWDALARDMLGSEYEWKQYATMMRQNKNLMDINIDALYNILKQNQGDVNDAMGSKSKEDDFSELKKITSLLAKAFNQRKFYSKLTNNNLRTSSTSQSANKKQEFVKNDNKNVENKDDEKNYVNEKINLEDDYFQEIINPNFDKIDSPFQQTSSLKPYVSNVILEKIIIDLKDEVVNLLEKEKANLETIESLKSKGFESSESSVSESEIRMKMIVIRLKKFMTKRRIQSVRRPKHSDLIWKKKGSSNTFNVVLSSVNHLKLNKDVKRYSRKDLLSCNNSHLGETSGAYVCNDAMNVSCNSSMGDFLYDNNFFIFDDEGVRISPVSEIPFRKKPRDSTNVHSKSNSNKSLPRTVHRWLPKLQP
uniref:CCHC-type domain-containing protein n=1 Tax=Tanacetum cinerariifolium TaxID=118510 RepID=A0A699IP10_TANCI|nr:hypothetical protein [Tanacetum cinerariifolium]